MRRSLLTRILAGLLALLFVAPETAFAQATAGSIPFADGSGGFSYDTSGLFWDDTNNKLVLYGTSFPVISITGDGVQPQTVKRLSTNTTNAPTLTRLTNELTTGAMADGFGAELTFAITETGSGNNNIGAIQARRANGADDTGNLIFQSASGGTLTDRLTVYYDGVVTAHTSFNSPSITVTNQGTLNLREASGNGTNAVKLRAPSSMSSDITYTLPGTDGSSGQILSTNGSGTLSWVTDQTSGGGGGTATDIQTSTAAGLGSASTAGRVRYVTDGQRGIVVDQGSKWVYANNPCNVGFHGALSDGSTNDDTAIRAALTAGCGTIYLPKNTIWKVSGNAMPSGTYTVVGEDFTAVIGCSGYPSCSSTAVTWSEGIAVQNVTVSESFGIDGSNSGDRKIAYAANRSGDAITNAHVAGNWDRTWGFSVGAASTGSPAGSDTPGIQLSNSSGGDTYFAQCLSNKNVNGNNYGCRLFNGDVFHLGSGTFQGSQAVLANLNSGVTNYTVFDCRDNSGQSTNKCFYADTNSTSTPTFIEMKANGTTKFKVDNGGTVHVAGSAGLSVTVNVKGSDGNNCSMTFTGGILTAETCP